VAMTPMPVYFFSLYISSKSPRSKLVISNLKQFCAESLQGHCKIKVIDIQKHPETAKKKNIVACPTLIKTKPLPTRIFIGNMADTTHILQGLGLA